MISQERGKDLGGPAFQKAYGAALSGSLLWHLTARRDQRLLSNKLSLASRSGTSTCCPVGGALRHLRQLSVKARSEAASPKFYSPTQPLSFFVALIRLLLPSSPLFWTGLLNPSAAVSCSHHSGKKIKPWMVLNQLHHCSHSACFHVAGVFHTNCF